MSKCPKCGAIPIIAGEHVRHWRCGSYGHQHFVQTRMCELAAKIAELTAENERLRAALEHIQVSDEGLGPDGARHAACMLIAKVALEKAKP